MNSKVITIDGSIATGKSSVSKRLSKELDGVYLPTGKLYRLISVFISRNNFDLSKSREIQDFLDFDDISFANDQFHIKDFFYSEEELFSIETISSVSNVSNNKSVRNLANKVFNKIIKENQANYMIVEGRDAGTVIYPNAFLKFFLTVSLEEAAKRRLIQENDLNGNYIDNELLKMVIKSVKKRDEIDSTRENNPLIKPIEAYEIDTSNITMQEVVSKIIKKIRQTEKEQIK